MYFHKSVTSLVLSIKALLDWRFWALGFLLAVFGASFQGFEFFRLHDLTQILSFSLNFKIIYLTWQIISWILSLLIGSLIFPSFVFYAKYRNENGGKVSLKKVFSSAKEVIYKYVVLLFVYYNMLFIIAGGGFLVAIAGLANNIVYGKGVSTIFDVTNNVPLVVSFVTIGIIASAFVSLLFSLVTPLLVLGEDGIINSIIKGMKLVNTDLPYILSAWIVINLVTLIPLMFLSFALNILAFLPISHVLAFVIGVVLFVLTFTPIVSVTNTFWAQIYMNIMGMMPLSMAKGQQ